MSHLPQSRPPLGTVGRRIDNLGPRSLVFEGREAELDETRDALRRSAKLSTYTVLTGMGGIGKSRLALEHAHHAEADYDVRWWVRAGDPASLQVDLVRLGVELGILAEPELVEASTREVLAWLSSHPRWLVVYDDAEGPTTLRELLPSPCRGHLLVTSRARAWRSSARVVELRRLSPPAARALLVQRAGRPDDGCADVVAQLVGHLPLALVQAGAYVEATACSFRDYLDLLAREGLGRLDEPKAVLHDHRQGVATSWEMSLAELRVRAPAAAALLDWLAFLDPGGVPMALLREHVGAMPAPLQACVGSPRALEDAIAVLRAFGLVEHDEGMLRVHRPIQAATRERLAADERQRLGGAVVRWLCDMPVRAAAAGVAEQIMAASAIDDCARADTERLAQALIDVGDFHRMRGAPHAAHAAYARSIALYEAWMGAQPGARQAQAGLAIALHRLGYVEVGAGNLAAARRCFSRAFALRKELAYHDPLSPRSQDDLATSLGELGNVALLEDDVATAVELLAEAVELREILVETAPEDPQARRALARWSGQLGEARARLAELGAGERSAPRAPRPLDVTRASLGELARVGRVQPLERTAKYLEAVRYAEALERFGKSALRTGNLQTARQSLRLLVSITTVLAKVDPRPIQAQRRAASALYALGKAERTLGELERARDRFRRCAEIFGSLLEVIPGDAKARRDLAVCLSKLGMVEMERGDLERARELLRRCCASFEALVVDAPRAVRALRDYGTSLVRLGTLEDEAGDLEATRELLRRNLDVAYAIAELEPSPMAARIEILRALYRLAKLEVRLGNHPEACELFRLMLEDADVLAQADREVAWAALDLVLLHAEPPTPAA